MTIGVVIIGRNEGPRLQRCLASVAGSGRRIVYVDSGSTDGSITLVRSMGAEAVELDMSRPFTSCAARNEGFARLDASDLQFVQFIDGDCEMQPGWLERAAAELEANTDVAVVCGRLRERNPGASIYNRLCDIEWDRPAGDVAACGGIAMMRTAVFRQVGGFNASLAAGEEPELCLRIRGLNGKIRRLPDEMALHDADMHRFSQWWRRCVRAGYGFAEGAAMHPRKSGETGGTEGGGGLYLRQARSAWIWGLIIPAFVLLLSWPTRGISLLLFLVYPVQAARIVKDLRRRRPGAPGDAWLYAGSCILAKWPQLLGQMRFYMTRRREHKLGVVPPPDAGVVADSAHPGRIY